jgi:hypothetical protein
MGYSKNVLIIEILETHVKYFIKETYFKVAPSYSINNLTNSSQN